MQYKKLSLLFSLLLLSFFSYSQIKYENINFRAPVDFPIYLSGNFGEIRSAHFHSGIDIKTQGVTGKKVHAVEDGYISRIKISINSYGKTIYINHSNGFTSVYGHLSKFNDRIEKLVKDIQYQNSEYEINYFPKQTELKILKGDIIGYSGNTGSSQGPHLHFEIRETNNQIPVNPLFFNFDIKDNISPILYNLVIYPINRNSKINSQNKALYLKLQKNNGNYTLVDTNQIFLSGEIGFGIEMNDFLNGSRNRCGVYSLDLFVDSSLIYNHAINKFSFYETGYVKSYIDYAEKIKSKRTFQKMFLAPNNNLSIYKSVKNRGIYAFNKDTLYSLKLVATDADANKSVLSFNVKGQKPDLPIPIIRDSIIGKYMNWNVENVFENDEVKIVIPKNALFDTIYFSYSKSKPNRESYSNIHHIHNIYTPLYKDYSISIQTKGLPDELRDKAFIAELLDDGKINAIGGTVVNNYIVSETRNFGDFVVLIDTVSPEIMPLSDYTNLKDNIIKFKIEDKLSGIKSYNGFIDNNWALFEYDQKNDLLFYVIDSEKIEKNTEHELELFVIDNNNNISTYYTTFYW